MSDVVCYQFVWVGGGVDWCMLTSRVRHVPNFLFVYSCVNGLSAYIVGVACALGWLLVHVTSMVVPSTLYEQLPSGKWSLKVALEYCGRRFGVSHSRIVILLELFHKIGGFISFHT